MKELRCNAYCSAKGESATKMSKKLDDFISELQERIYEDSYMQKATKRLLLK